MLLLLSSPPCFSSSVVVVSYAHALSILDSGDWNAEPPDHMWSSGIFLVLLCYVYVEYWRETNYRDASDPFQRLFKWTGIRYGLVTSGAFKSLFFIILSLETVRLRSTDVLNYQIFHFLLFFYFYFFVQVTSVV